MVLIPTSPAFWGGGGIPGLGIDFNGVDERMGVTANAKLMDPASANQFVWEAILQRRNNVSILQRFFGIDQGGTTLFGVDTATAAGAAPTNPGDLRVFVNSPVTKNGVLPNAFPEDTWVHIVVAFALIAAVRTLKVFINGVDTNFPGGSWINTTNAAGAPFADVDTGCRFAVTNAISSFLEGGLLHSSIWWQNDVSAAQVSALFDNPLRDRREIFGSYGASMRDVLAHFWAPSMWNGGTDSTLGTDRGLVGVARNIMDAANNITGAADLVLPYP